mmetsp:Transcript_58743/g.134749  ORF Transcript_58743/g.134749 Transcript_58743/m.134749 type:complete len:215 (+) Transcript_58743:1170-1814(+)
MSEQRSEGCMALVPRSVRQLFVRFDAIDPAKAADARLHAFKQLLLPTLLRAVESGADGQTLLFVPSYFDFVRVRELLKAEDVPFETLSEYSAPAAVSRVRSAMQQRRLGGLLLYSGRAHFFHRHNLRGARHIAFYALPLYERFYPELLQMLAGAAGGASVGVSGVADGVAAVGASGASCVTLMCKLDLLQLGRLVGDARAARMLTDRESSFVFY